MRQECSRGRSSNLDRDCTRDDDAGTNVAWGPVCGRGFCSQGWLARLAAANGRRDIDTVAGKDQGARRACDSEGYREGSLARSEVTNEPPD